MPQPFVFRTIDLDGQTIRTAVRPGKEGSTPLLIFNGIGANLELVFPFVQALDPELEVIAFDVPGVGGSSTPSVPYRFPGLAKLAARMLDYLDYGQVNAIGVSWGGALAQQFAHDYPEPVIPLPPATTPAPPPAGGAPLIPADWDPFAELLGNTPAPSATPVVQPQPAAEPTPLAPACSSTFSPGCNAASWNRFSQAVA